MSRFKSNFPIYKFAFRITEPNCYNYYYYYNVPQFN